MSARIDRSAVGSDRRRRFRREGLRGLVPVCLLLLPTPPALGGEADVIRAKAVCNDRSVCRFAVTVRHADEGWDHYADGYEILKEDGSVLAKRVLRHPHVQEQPFTRPLTGVTIPPDITRVRIRAHDSQHGYGGGEVTVELERPRPAANGRDPGKQAGGMVGSTAREDPPKRDVR